MNLKGNNKLIFMLTFFLFCCLVVSSVSLAEEITLKEAVKSGLEENNDLKDLRDRIASLERELALIAAQQDWQLELGANYSHTFTEEEGNTQLGSSVAQNSVALKVKKEFASGLNINPEVSVNEEDLSPELSVNISQQLYPSTPSGLDKQYFKTQKELLKVKGNYLNQRADQVLTWLESYLSLSRLIEKREIYQKSLQQAEANREEVRARKEIGEAGKEEVLTARLGVKEATYQLEEINNKIEEAMLTFKLNMGLKSEQELKVHTSPYIVELREKAEKLTEKYLADLADNDLMSRVEKNNYNLFANLIDREILKKELEWLKSEDGAEVNVTGDYDQAQDDLTVGINVSYDLYDGGQQDINYNDKQVEIEASQADYNNLYQELKKQLKQYKNNLELSQLKLEQEKLRRERSEHQAEVAEQQFKMGLIDYLDYQENWLDGREAKVNVKSIQDQLFLARLNLIKFVDINELMEEI